MSTAIEAGPAKKTKPSTAHLKVVPETRELRDRVRAAAADFGKSLDRSKPLTKESLREMAEGLLRQMGLGEQYLGFTMVAITNEFWREQVSAIAFNRRLLLLPHCLKNAEGCPAEYECPGGRPVSPRRESPDSTGEGRRRDWARSRQARPDV